MNEIHQNIEAVYKSHYGQFVTLLCQRFPVLPIENIEDIIQDAFMEATSSWTEQNIPLNPGGWLYQACKNKSINLIKKSGKLTELSLVDQVVFQDEDFSDDHFQDGQIRMLMMCCHPNLPPKTQVVLALKYVANLRIRNIGLQLGMDTPAIEKLLYRARQTIKEERIVLTEGYLKKGKERLSVMHKVIYMLFNEGYKQKGIHLQQGKELCEQALILNKTLLDSPLCTSETKALQSLMLFNIARINGRFDASGNNIELEYQDRSTWNDSLISLAHQLLVSSEDAHFSPYHLESAIAYVHCTAKTFEQTDWATICKYYEALLKIYPSPFVQINYAVSLQYLRQFKKAFAVLEALSDNAYFNRSPILNTALGKYYDRIGDHAQATVYFNKAEKCSQDLESSD